MTGILKSLRTSVANWNRRRKTIRALSGLESRILKDIGLDRSEITSVAAELTGQSTPSRVHTAAAQTLASLNSGAATIGPANKELPKAA